ncbi:hypothetical protein AST01_07695 [Staphylococcus equorum]|nr:hypothetical protein AST01_07695 [Staphylococcus equorum]
MNCPPQINGSKIKIFSFIIKTYFKFETLKTLLLKGSVFSCISILFSAIPLTYFEPSVRSYNDGVWLAIVTVTTVVVISVQRQ